MERGGGAGHAVAEPGREPEPSIPAVQGEGLVSGAAAGATASLTVASVDTAGTGHRPDGGRDGRGDRGGRGRRGRRRRGGRGSGLPDSKFFSPRAEAAGAPAAEEERDTGAETPAPSHVSFEPVPRTFQADDDFMVLPGESLAKYAPGDGEPEPPAAVAPVNTTEPVEEQQVESALPVEHPLAGFGEVAAWVTSPATAEAPAATDQHEEGVADVPNTIPDNDDEGLSAAEVVEAELAAEVRAAEVFEDADDVSAEADVVAENEPTSEGGADEGPEPARIPTSLTAALKEQGHRYPHRVSRRMRRKMRGGQPGEAQNGEEGQNQASDDAGPAPEGRPETRGEGRSVTPRREERATEPREP